MASKATIRNFIGRVKVEEGSMGAGYVLVAEDDRLGPLPLASISIPMHSKAESLAVAEYFADAWNAGLGQLRKTAIDHAANE